MVVTAIVAERPRRGRLALGSLLLGLAIDARPTLAVGGLVALAAGLFLIRRRRRGHRGPDPRAAAGDPVRRRSRRL